MSNLLDSALKRVFAYVDTSVGDVRAFRAIVTGQSNGMVQIRRIHASTAETALRARVVGFDLQNGDEVLCLPMADGLPVVVGLLQRATPSSYTLSTPLNVDTIVMEAPNTPVGMQSSQNSADTASSTDTSNYVTTLTADIALPTGNWTIRAMTTQMLSHSSAGSVVRAQTRIGGTAGVNLSAAVPADPTRATMVTQATRTSQTGTVTIDAQYRPNASGTAYSGGGTIFVYAYRTS